MTKTNQHMEGANSQPFPFFHFVSDNWKSGKEHWTRVVIFQPILIKPRRAGIVLTQFLVVIWIEKTSKKFSECQKNLSFFLFFRLNYIKFKRG